MAFSGFGFLFRETESYRVWHQIQQDQTTLKTAGVAHALISDIDLTEVLNFPVPAQPRVSIIIPVHGQIEYTIRCLKSLRDHSTTASFEVIVVNDASPDNTHEILSRMAGITLMDQKENRGFIRSCNTASDKARGEFLVFLNNDTQVLPHWLDELIRTFKDQPEAGLVGSQLIYPSGKLQEAGAIIWSDGRGQNVGRNADRARPEFNYLREVDYCSGASLMISRTLFEDVGRFDERYAPAYYEDVDLAFAVRAVGKKVFYQPLSQVIHFEGISSGTDESRGVKSFQEVNRQKFSEKWRDALAHQPSPGTPASDAVERRVPRRALVLASQTPTPDRDAGSEEMVHSMNMLRSLGFQVTFIPVDNFLRLESYTPELMRTGVRCLYAPYETEVEKHLEAQGQHYDLVLFFKADCAEAHITSVKKHCPSAKTIFHTVDLNYLREQREAEVIRSPVLAEQAGQTQTKELGVMQQIDATLVLSEVERALIHEQSPDLPVRTFPMIQNICKVVAPFSEREHILFVGSFLHAPNEDAVLYFANAIWPRVQQDNPGMKLYIVGSPVPEAIQDLASEDIVPLGHVEDLDGLMDRCRLSVAPIRFGAGVKGKIARSLSCGLPCVATSMAVEGMNLKPGLEIRVEDEPVKFAEAVVQTVNDSEAWSHLSRNGHAFAQQHYSFETGLQSWRNLLRDLKVLQEDTI